LILHERSKRDRPAQSALPARPPDRLARRAVGGARAGIHWRDYDRFMQANVKHIGDERLTKCRPTSISNLS
jgi:hypothetical protein